MRISRHIRVCFVFFTVPEICPQSDWLDCAAVNVSIRGGRSPCKSSPTNLSACSKTDQAPSQLRVFTLAVPSAWNTPHPSPKSELEPSHPSDLRLSSWFSHPTISHQSVHFGSAATALVVTVLFSISNSNTKLVIAGITLPSLTPSIMPRTRSEPSQCLRMNEPGDSVFHRALIRHT